MVAPTDTILLMGRYFLDVTAPVSIVDGVGFTLTITAKDAYNREAFVFDGLTVDITAKRESTGANLTVSHSQGTFDGSQISIANFTVSFDDIGGDDIVIEAITTDTLLNALGLTRHDYQVSGMSISHSDLLVLTDDVYGVDPYFSGDASVSYDDTTTAWSDARSGAYNELHNDINNHDLVTSIGVSYQIGRDYYSDEVIVSCIPAYGVLVFNIPDIDWNGCAAAYLTIKSYCQKHIYDRATSITAYQRPSETEEGNFSLVLTALDSISGITYGSDIAGLAAGANIPFSDINDYIAASGFDFDANPNVIGNKTARARVPLPADMFHGLSGDTIYLAGRVSDGMTSRPSWMPSSPSDDHYYNISAYAGTPSYYEGPTVSATLEVHV